MAQHDQVIDNGPGLTVRTDINAAFAAIFSCSSGPVEPAVKVPGQLWFDTSTNPPTTRQRNGANTAWTSLSGLSNDGLTLFLKEGTTTRGSLAAAGGADTGTVALRAFNNAGAQTSLFYMNTSEIATDRNTFSLFNSNDQAIWFRKPDGNIRGGVYNFTGGSMDLRAYNTTSNTLINLLRVGADRQMSSLSYGMTYNSDGTTGDLWQNHRVSTVRATRFYFNQNGDFVLQQTDDNYASHFINIFNYVRSSGISYVTHLLGCNGVQLNGTGGSGNGLYNGNGDAASYATTNVWLRSWNGIGFPSSLDGVNRIFMNTRNGDIYTQGRVQGGDIVSAGTIYTGNGSSFMQADGNIIFSGGMTSVGATLHQALSARATVYTGDWVDETNFPLGHPVIARGGAAIARNAAGTIRLGTATNAEYRYNSGTGTVLAGTWRHRGYFDDAEGGVGGGLYERTA